MINISIQKVKKKGTMSYQKSLLIIALFFFISVPSVTSSSDSLVKVDCSSFFQKIPSIPLGTGAPIPIFGLGLLKVTDKAIILKAIEKGVRLFESYGNEHILGEALKIAYTWGLKREDFFIVTNVNINNITSETLISSCINSLNKLQSQYIDLYLLHKILKDNALLARIIPLLATLVENKQVKHIGISNFTKKEIHAAQSYTNIPLLVDQEPYSLAERKQVGNISFYTTNNMVLIAANPLKFLAKEEQPEQIMVTMYTKYKKTPAQIALKWILSHPGIVVIPNCSNEKSLDENEKSLDENLGALDNWQLDEKDMKSLSMVYPQTGCCYDVAPEEEQSLCSIM